MRGRVGIDLALVVPPADDSPRSVKHNRSHGNIRGVRSGFSLGESLPHRRLEAGHVARHHRISLRSADGRGHGALKRLTKPDSPGQAGQYLVGKQVQVAGQRPDLHLVDAKVGEDRHVSHR